MMKERRACLYGSSFRMMIAWMVSVFIISSIIQDSFIHFIKEHKSNFKASIGDFPMNLRSKMISTQLLTVFSTLCIVQLCSGFLPICDISVLSRNPKKAFVLASYFPSLFKHVNPLVSLWAIKMLSLPTATIMWQ